MNSRTAGFMTGLLVVGTLAMFGSLLWWNAESSPEVVIIVPTELPPTDDPEAWQNLLRQGFGSNSTPLPTVPIPTREFAPPTLPSLEQEDSDLLQIQPATVGVRPTEAFSDGVTPTRPPEDTATPPPAGTPTPLGASNSDSSSLALLPVFTEQSVELATRVWQPPPLVAPLSRDPFGRDHYWLSRPVDSDATNFGLFYYPYGSDGPGGENPWRVHHGIDMPNPVGETVRAAGSGTVIWAADSRIEDVELTIFQSSPAYGNVVMIEHDFGYRGERIYTLYAHLSSVLVQRGQLVNSGDVIGLVGNTGRVSGPHVHFEVRVGGDRYADTYNPVLWMVPYVGHGVIAGRVSTKEGNILMDQDITLRRWSTGLIQDTTTSYIFQDTPSDVNSDPIWNENFVFADVEVGRYELISVINGERISKIIDVQEGTTNFVELKPEDPATVVATETPTPTSTAVFISTPLRLPGR
ncbi:MAG: M23 family metallopeptidase [Chloroflexota bacterium]